MSMRPLALLLALSLLPGCTPPPSGPRSLDGAAIEVPAMEERLLAIMDKGGVPGLSLALIAEGEIVYAGGLGVRSVETGAANDADTVFAGASFSKTVFAYLVLLLVEEGLLELDRPLQDYLGQPLAEHPHYADLAGDERAALLTARHCLSHTTGFPNWRFFTEDGRLRFLFDPGTRHGYSGEGIALLQRVVEKVSGQGLEELARERIFAPLGLTRTSYVWQEAWEANSAVPHDRYARAKPIGHRRKADAAGSLFTSAGDYAKLYVELLDPTLASPATVEELLRRQVDVDYRRMFGPGKWEQSDEGAAISLGWGLGWGRFDGAYGRAAFHTGHDTGWQNYTVLFPDARIGVVFLSNSDNFESVARELADATIGDRESPFDFLGYPHFDPDADRTPPPPRTFVELEEAQMVDYPGDYALPGGRTLTVRLEAGALEITTDRVDWAPLRAESERRFFLPHQELTLVFVRDDQGAVVLAELHLADGAVLNLARM